MSVKPTTRALVTLGVGPVSGKFKANVKLSEMDPPNAVVLSGDLAGPLGSSRGSGHVTLTDGAGGTEVAYDYEVEITGRVAAVGGRMLDGATRVVINQFFRRLTAQVGGAPEPDGPAGKPSLGQRLRRKLGGGQ